ncbi:MAG TPA: glycosyltransferase family 39 protein [Candidatus Saccharimonadales bacterium]|nr:glycosyltransferase family 39 protein [Candidatus Saccharimonadales bacterium]
MSSSIAPAPALRLKRLPGRKPAKQSRETTAANATSRTTLWTRLKIAVTLAVCLIGAFLISRFLLIDNSIRLDEAQSLWQTSHSLQGTLKVIAQDVHVPLYHTILHSWQTFFGQSIQTARYLSLLFFMLSIPVVYLLARRILSINWSLFVTMLFSFSPFMNWYANEARMYTMLVLVATLSQLFFVKLIQSQGKRGWLGYTLTALVGIYSHYFFFFSLLTQGIFYLLTRKQWVRGTFLRFAGLAGLLAAAFTPWFLYFRAQGSASNTSPNLQTPSSVDFFNVFSQFSFGFQTDVLNTILVSPWPVLVIVALMSVRGGQRITRPVGYMIAAAFVPVLTAFIVSYALTPFFVSRYMIACVPPLLILTVWFISHYRRALYVPIAGLMIGMMIATSYQQYTSAATPVKEDFKAAAAYINKHADASDIVVLSAPFTIYPFNYYYDGEARVATLPIWDRTVPGAIPGFEAAKLPEQVRQLNKDHQYVYLLLSSDQGYQEDIYQYYEQRFENPESIQFSPDLQLHVYRVGYSVLKPAGEL